MNIKRMAGVCMGLVLSAFVIQSIDSMKGCRSVWQCLEWSVRAPSRMQDVPLVAQCCLYTALAVFLGTVLYLLLQRPLRR